ncbi:hypothetical protein Tco_1445401 [Tanacetum coccineum]
MTMSILPQDEPLTDSPVYIRPSSHRARKSSPTLDEAHLAPKQPIQVNKITSSCGSVVVPTTLKTAWKIPSKLLLNMHPRVSTSRRYQIKLEKALIDFESHQERRLSSLETQLGEQQDDMISKINLLWKTISEKLDDRPTHNTA